MRFCIIQGDNCFSRGRIPRAAFEGQRALSDCRKHHVKGQNLADAFTESKATQPGLSQHDGIELAVIKLPQSSIDVASDVGH
jgi:hypothetical protein